METDLTEKFLYCYSSESCSVKYYTELCVICESVFRDTAGQRRFMSMTRQQYKAVKVRSQIVEWVI